MIALLIVSSLAIGMALPAVDTQHKNPEAYAEIQSYENVLHDDGHYVWSQQTSNGIAAHEEGLGAHAANGVSSYTAPDGVQYRLVYTADENGYHPEGAHLPTPPPAPEHVLKSLEQLRANPPRDQKDFNLAALDAAIARLRH
ncbi:pupal cuticle protein Edg-78E-like [Toxorhynchites rutilus septentrionalis]|uniref:pupal cuticle protein Edg-78E-like n=1 Tax=Toxorhynchites rutilus septentrionalis TaxID=329112 RepID=UPI0024794ED0|nr:pupal cuticle protein Edg-78E-like [Toxorhynchites rutilus septentrionalis]